MILTKFLHTTYEKIIVLDAILAFKEYLSFLKKNHRPYTFLYEKSKFHHVPYLLCLKTVMSSYAVVS